MIERSVPIVPASAGSRTEILCQDAPERPEVPSRGIRKRQTHSRTRPSSGSLPLSVAHRRGLLRGVGRTQESIDRRSAWSRGSPPSQPPPMRRGKAPRRGRIGSPCAQGERGFSVTGQFIHHPGLSYVPTPSVVYRRDLWWTDAWTHGSASQGSRRVEGGRPVGGPNWRSKPPRGALRNGRERSRPFASCLALPDARGYSSAASACAGSQPVKK
jgi:hypothetical protein